MKSKRPDNKPGVETAEPVQGSRDAVEDPFIDFHTDRPGHERVVADIAARLVGPGDLDKAIHESLRDIGRMCGADRSYLFQINEQTGVVINTHEWCAPGASANQGLLRNNLQSSFPWASARIRAGKAINIPDTSDLPPEAPAEQKELRRLGIKASLVAPVLIKGEVAGALGLDSASTAREWSAENVTLLEVCASMIAAALGRAGAEERLRSEELRYRQLFENAPIPLWQADYSDIIEHLEALRAAVSDWSGYFANDPEAVGECLSKLKIKDANKAALDLFRAGSKEDFLKSWRTVFTTESFPGLQSKLIALAGGQNRFETETKVRTLAGEEIHIEIRTFALPGSENTLASVVCALTDVTERKRAEIVSARRIEYEKAVSNLAARFVAPASLSQAINETLKEIGAFSGTDSFLYLFEPGQHSGCSCTWQIGDVAINVEPKSSWPFSSPWILAKLNRGEAVRINDHSQKADIIDNAGAVHSVGSLLMMPLFRGDRAIGCIGLSSARTREWDEDNLSLLLVSSTIVGNALERQANDEALKTSEQKYRTLIESAGDAIIIAEAETGLIIDANKEAARLLGRSTDEIIGTHHKDLHPPGEAERYARIFRKHVDANLQLPEDQNMFVVHKSGRKIPVEISGSLLEVGGKRIVQGIFHNITDRHRARELREALSKIISTISSTLQPETIIDRITVEAAQALGVENAMTLLADGEDWVVKHVHGYGEGITGTRFNQNELVSMKIAAQKNRALALNGKRVDRVLTENLGIKSLLVVPLVVREERIGGLMFCRHTQAAAFTERQIDFAEQLAAAASFALENARLYAEKRNIADALQQSLLRLPKRVEGVRFGNLYRSATGTARVGGDFYDIFKVHGDRIGVVIGDVSGKGLEAAKLTSLVKNTIRAYAAEDYPPDQVMKKTNDLTIQMSRSSTFVTVFFGLLDKKSGQLSFCAAGHPPPLIKAGPGRAEFLNVNSPVIGIMHEFKFSTDSRQLNPGEILFLYTDGATDARQGNDFFGDRRLQALVAGLQPKTTAELPQLVFAELLEFAGPELTDDLALLAVSLGDD